LRKSSSALAYTASVQTNPKLRDLWHLRCFEVVRSSASMFSTAAVAIIKCNRHGEDNGLP